MQVSRELERTLNEKFPGNPPRAISGGGFTPLVAIRHLFRSFANDVVDSLPDSTQEADLERILVGLLMCQQLCITACERLD
jgi:hypothetical protein